MSDSVQAAVVLVKCSSRVADLLHHFLEGRFLCLRTYSAAYRACIYSFDFRAELE